MPDTRTVPTAPAELAARSDGEQQPAPGPAKKKRAKPARRPAAAAAAAGGAAGRTLPLDLVDHPSRIAIVGYTGHRERAPFDAPVGEWALWGMNNLHQFMPPGGPRPDGGGKYRWDLWFNLHLPSEIEQDGEHVAWLCEDHGMPIVLMPATIDWLAARHGGVAPWWAAFPAEPLMARTGTRYYTNTVSWQVALATAWLHSPTGVRPGAEIGLWGIDLATASEYGAQRPSAEFFLGVAAGAGIAITIPPESDLLSAGAVYGAEDDRRGARLRSRRKLLQVRQQEAAQAAANLEGQLGQVRAQLHTLQGAIEMLDFELGTQHQPVKPERDAPPRLLAGI